MSNKNIIFSGLSKNSYKTLVKNVEFIQKFIHSSKYKNVELIVVDSDSNDGSKEHLYKASKETDGIILINRDNIEKESDSRIERIAICRNLGLDYIKDNYSKNDVIYIPFDMDIDLFKYTSQEKFLLLIEKVISRDTGHDAVFPCSVPYYYDVFALRAKGWLNFNTQLVVNFFKKYIRIGSFIWNYIFIFRYQWSKEKIKKKNFKLYSAFGGIGIYNLSNIEDNKLIYKTSDKNREFISEHILFNSSFNALHIENDWTIPSPFQHVEYKSSNFFNKFRYILRTIKYDLLNFIP